MRSALRTVNALTIRGLGSVLQLLLIMALGRMAGAILVGAYVLFTNWVSVLVSVWGVGIPIAAMKSFAIHGQKLPADRSNVTKRAAGIVALELAAIVIGAGLLASMAVLSVVLILPISLRHSIKVRILLAATFTAAFYAGLKTAVEALKGIGRAAAAFSLEFNIIPLILLVVAAGATIGLWQLTLQALIFAYVATIAFSAAIAIFLLQKSILYFDHEQPRKYGMGRQELLPFWFVQIINSLYGAIPYLVLPLLVSNRKIGYFSVAYKLVSVVGTLITVLASIYGPIFATLASRSDPSELRRRYLESLCLVIGLTIPILAGLVIFAHPILKLFGNEFVAAQTILVVLAAGRMGSAVLGLTEIYLNMTGMAKKELHSALISIIFFLTIVYPLFITYNLTGIAVAFSMALFCRAAISLLFVRRTWTTPKGAM